MRGKQSCFCRRKGIGENGYAKAKKVAEVEAYKREQTLMGKADQPHDELTSPAQEAAEASKTAEIVQEEETFRYSCISKNTEIKKSRNPMISALFLQGIIWFQPRTLPCMHP